MQCRLRFSSVFSLILCLAGIAYSPHDLAAQYFGQNRVRFERLDFKVLKTDHFDIYFYEENSFARETGRMAERWYSRLSTILNHQLPPHQPIILYASPAAFRSTTILPTELGEGVGGVTEGLRRRVIMPSAGPLADTDHILGHELVHAFQFDMTAGPGMVPAALRLPLWFIEGMAEYLSVGPEDSMTSMWVRDAVLREDLPSLRQLDDPRFFPYRFGQAFWAYVGGTYGDETIGRILRVAGHGGVEQGISVVLGVTASNLVEKWHEALRQKNAPVL